MLSLNNGIIFTSLEDEGMIVDTNAGKYIYLNQTASDMVQLIIASESEEDIPQKLATKFNIDQQTVKSHFEDLVSQLVELKLLCTS